jgi:hypothetical protein
MVASSLGETTVRKYVFALHGYLPLHRLALFVPERPRLVLSLRGDNVAKDTCSAYRWVVCTLTIPIHVGRIVAWADRKDEAALVLELERVVCGDGVERALRSVVDLVKFTRGSDTRLQST